MKAILKNRGKNLDIVKPELEESSSPSKAINSPSSVQQQIVCRVCGRTAPASPLIPVEYQVLVCEACKKFFCRYRGKIQQEKCICGGNSTVPDDERCRVCRFKRCEVALVDMKAAMAAAKTIAARQRALAHQKAEAEKTDFSKLPCAVCGCSSSGFHFGIVSCEGCKGFFRRSVNENYKLKYKCKSEGSPGKLCPSSSSCRKCRLQRCVDAGMSLKDIAVGRHTLRRRAEIDAAIKRHSETGSFLKSKISRRNRDHHLNAEIATPQTDEQTGTQQTTPPSSQPFVASESSSDEDSSSSSEVEHKPVVAQVAGESSDKFALISSSVSNGGNTASTSSTSTLGIAYPDSIDCNFEESLRHSSKWFIERAVEAAARLSGISTYRISVDYSVTEEEFVTARVAADEHYAKCISEFVTALPGSNTISLHDRVLLFTQAFFPIAAAQVSLNFDVEKQLPNHFSFDRKSAAWDINAKLLPKSHFAVEDYLREAGNRLVTAIACLKEFALFCALLLLNPDTPELENVQTIRALRRRYDLALSYLFETSSGVRSEQRLGEIYKLFPYFREATSVFQNLFADVNATRANDRVLWTPLFTQIETQIVKLDMPSSSATTPQ